MIELLSALKANIGTEFDSHGRINDISMYRLIEGTFGTHCYIILLRKIVGHNAP